MDTLLSINQIEVKKLFGHLNYTLKLNEEVDKNLMILYGDNGSGKTTILKLIYYLLSTDERRGHKTKLSETKFKSLVIKLSNGVEISAYRKKGLIGSYHYRIDKENQNLHDLYLKSNPDNSITLHEASKAVYNNYLTILKYLRDLKINIFFLTDKRNKLPISEKILMEEDIPEISSIKFSRALGNLLSVTEKKSLISSTKSNVSLTKSVSKLEKWINEKTIEANKIGERDTNNIYSEIINRVSRSNRKSSNIVDQDFLIDKINDIIAKSFQYSKYGLISLFEVEDMINALTRASKDKLAIISSIVEPYLEGIEARLKALEELQYTIDILIKHVNSYFSYKKLTFHLQSGFELKNEFEEEPISFELLSSGEKQLLLLFINTITADKNTSIFIIDEPEISLNIKWQRKLLKTLLNLNRKSRIQFIIATHSFEILTPNRSNVVKLTHTKE